MPLMGQYYLISFYWWGVDTTKYPVNAQLFLWELAINQNFAIKPHFCCELWKMIAFQASNTHYVFTLKRLYTDRYLFVFISLLPQLRVQWLLNITLITTFRLYNISTNPKTCFKRQFSPICETLQLQQVSLLTESYETRKSQPTFKVS